VFGEGDKDEWNTTLTVPRARLMGLEVDKDTSFKLTGEAGAITFSGKFTGTKGTGNFTFTPDAGFVTFLESKKNRPHR
jgi:hypothetical protein